MLLITTTKCHDYGHAELTLALDSTGLEPDARWFAGVLEQLVQSGSRFQPGQSLQIGWSVVWFVTLPNKTLGFEEPDMKSVPLVRQPGLTHSLRHLRLHKDTLESVLCSDALSLFHLSSKAVSSARVWHVRVHSLWIAATRKAQTRGGSLDAKQTSITTMTRLR